MSIADELREWPREHRGYELFDFQLTAIADLIDAEHERMMDELRARDGESWRKGYGECHAELLEGNEVIAADLERMGWVRLPEDADGEVIHVGDEVVRDGRNRGHVVALMLSKEPEEWGGNLHWGVQLDGEHAPTALDAFSLRHYHAPTVEDVLREFADKMNENIGMYTAEAIDADEWRDADAATIAEYASKLRLAEEDA